MEEWNEHIEEIIQNKSFNELTESDVETLGEIASDEKSYESYRQLLNDVIPAVKEESIKPSSGLDAKIQAIVEKEDNKGGAYWNWMKFAAAAAILVAVFSVSYWFIQSNAIQKDAEVAQNKVKSEEINEKTSSDNSKSEESREDTKELESPNSKEGNAIENNFSADGLNSQISENSGSGVVDLKKKETETAIEEETIEFDDEVAEISDQESFAQPATESNEEAKDITPSVSSAKRSSDERNKSSADVDQLEGVATSGNTYNYATNKYANSRAEAKSPKEDDVRDDIIGTIELAKPASAQEDAFSLLTIAF